MQKLPLENIRVLDFTQVRMGPQLTQWLAVMGAEVIKIETNLRQEVSQMVGTPGKQEKGESLRAGYFAALNYGKKAITLNMKNPKAADIVKELVKRSDLVAENFGGPVMEHWGIGYGELKKIKPDIIFYAGSGWGRDGAYARRPAYAPVIDAYSGLTYVNGYPDGEPTAVGTRGWTDSIVSQYGVFAVLSALFYRSKTGKGQYIELSMVEGGLAFAPELVLSYTINKKQQERMGNRDDVMAPHGCYRCRGEDKWVAIAVGTEKEWAAFCKAIGNPEWTKNEKFSGALNRWKNQEELDKWIGEWTINYDHYEVMRILQEAGVMAGASLNMKEVANDQHLQERGYLVDVMGDTKNKLRRPRLPWRLSDLPQADCQYVPSLGEHNQYVFGELLGLSAEDIKALEQAKVIY